MKKLMMVLFLGFAVSFVCLAVANAGNTNGQLDEKVATEWAKSPYKCPEITEEGIQETESGFTITCPTEFQGLPGVYAKTFTLSYTANPDKPFLID